MIDGFEFSMYKNYYCKFSYQTETGLEAATKKCEEDSNCTMISALECDVDSEYMFCNHSTELLPKVESCTLWKIGKNIWIQSTRYGLYILSLFLAILSLP